MDLKKLSKVKPSSNFEDHTGYTPVQRKLDTALTLLNPVYAVRNVRKSLIESGTIAPPKSKIRLGLPKLGGQ